MIRGDSLALKAGGYVAALSGVGMDVSERQREKLDAAAGASAVPDRVKSSSSSWHLSVPSVING